MNRPNAEEQKRKEQNRKFGEQRWRRSRDKRRGQQIPTQQQHAREEVKS